MTPRATTTPSASAAAAAEVLRKLRRTKTGEPVGLFGVFFLSVVCFLGCFLYLRYLVISPNGMLSLGEGRQQEQRRDGFLEIGLSEGACDLFQGKWVWDESYPLYESRDCPFLDEGFRCSENGRPDSFYTKWRWQPNYCDLPRFNATMMLERLRDRRLVFVGDSIGRNQWESLLCMLSSAVPNKSSIYEVNGNPITKHNGFLAFKFRDFNCTIEYHRATFLVVQGRPPAGVPEKVKTTIKLDVMDWSCSKWKTADVLIFNTGHWWNYEKTIRSGCYFQVGNEVKLEMSVQSAYRRAIETLVDWIGREVNTNKTKVVYRTYSPVHFSGGYWKNGGRCHQEALPDLEISQLSAECWALQTVGEVISERTKKGDLHFLNITQMTAQRKDGHSSLYYLGPSEPLPVHKQDCSHWCLPGVPDAWNELLYAFSLGWDLVNHQTVTKAHVSDPKQHRKEGLHWQVG